MNVPDPITETDSETTFATSIYGPDYNLKTGKYTFVGSYTKSSQGSLQKEIYGFVFIGHLGLNLRPKIYPSVNLSYFITFLHSTANGLVVGNSGISKVPATVSNSTISYVYNYNLESGQTGGAVLPLLITIPNYKTVTTYGIVYNGNDTYTIVGGASTNEISITDIYIVMKVNLNHMESRL